MSNRQQQQPRNNNNNNNNQKKDSQQHQKRSSRTSNNNNSSSSASSTAAAASSSSSAPSPSSSTSQQQQPPPPIRKQNIVIWEGRPGKDFSDLTSKGIDVRFFEKISVAEHFLQSHLAECSFPDKPCQIFAFVVETKAGVEFILKSRNGSSNIFQQNKIATCCLITPWSGSEISSELHQEVRNAFDVELDCRSFGRGSYSHQMMGMVFKTFLGNQSVKQQVVAVPQGLPRNAKFLGQSPLGAVWSFFDHKTKMQCVARYAAEDKRSDIDIEQYRRRSLLSPEYLIPAKPIVTKPKFNNLVVSEKYEKHLEMIFKSEPLPLYLFYKIIRVCILALQEVHKHNCIFRCLSPLIICFDQTPKIRIETSFMILKEHPKMWINGLLPRYTAPEVLLWKKLEDDKAAREEAQEREQKSKNNTNNNNKSSPQTNVSSSTSTHLPFFGEKPKALPHQISEAVDIWSLGCCCVRLLTGNQPFTDASCREGERDLDQLLEFFNELNEKGEEYTPELPSYTPPKLRQLIHKMLRFNPRERITVPELLQHELFQEENFPNPPIDCQDEILDLATHFKIPIKPDSEKFHKLEELLVRCQRKSRVKANGFQLVEAWMVNNRHLSRRFEKAAVATAKKKKKEIEALLQARNNDNNNTNNNNDDDENTTRTTNQEHVDPSSDSNNNNTGCYNRGGGNRGGRGGRGGRGISNDGSPQKQKKPLPTHLKDDSDYDLEIEDAIVAFAGVADEQVEQCLRHGVLPVGHRLNVHESPNIGSGTIGSFKKGTYLWRFPISAAKSKKSDELVEGDVVDIILFDVLGGCRTADFDGVHQFRADQYDEADIFISRDELYCIWPNVVMQPKYVLRLKIQKNVALSLIGPRRFIVLPKVLGQGGFGKVFSALQLPEHKPIACKTYHIAQGSIDACRTEFEAMKSVREHEHVVKVISFEIHNDIAFLFMELLSCTLMDIVEAAGAIPEEQVAKYFYESACGLESLSLEGRCHCDIKLGNLGISYEGSVKLVDFGLMATVGNTELKGFTLNYVAPEILNAQKNGDKIAYTHAADVFSLGVSMLMMLKGWTRLEFHNINKQFLSNKKNNNTDNDNNVMSDSSGHSSANNQQNNNSSSQQDQEDQRKSIDFVDLRQQLLISELNNLASSRMITRQMYSTLSHCLDLDPNKRPSVSELTQLERYLASSSSSSSAFYSASSPPPSPQGLSPSSASAAAAGSPGASPLLPSTQNNNNNNNNNNAHSSFASSSSAASFGDDNSMMLMNRSNSLMTRTVTFASSAIFGGSSGGNSESPSALQTNNNSNIIARASSSGIMMNSNNLSSFGDGGGGGGNSSTDGASTTVHFSADVTETITFGNFSMPAGMLSYK